MGIDHRQWDLYETCFTDECEFDFSSFSGKPPTTLTAKQWRTNVESLNGNFDATAHQMSNHVISKLKKSSATCITELRAQHWFSHETMSKLGHTGEVNWCVKEKHGKLHVARSMCGGDWVMKQYLKWLEEEILLSNTINFSYGTFSSFVHHPRNASSEARSDTRCSSRETP